jgi:hypothetical protein
MAGFLFRLETVDGDKAVPPTLEAAVPTGAPATRSLSVPAACCAWSASGTTTPTSRLSCW